MASSTTFSSLTNDILFEIFIYLPLQTIYRSKSVSKVWLSNLSNQNFITKWFQFNSKTFPWIQYHMIPPHYNDFHQFKFRNAYLESHSQFISRNDYGFSFEFLINEKALKIEELFLLGSSNGLVLCFPWKFNGWGRYLVCNPLTQKWVSLPTSPRYQSIPYPYEFNGIFCENSLSGSCCYKVVCIPGFTSSKVFNVDMFDSDLGGWRSFEVSCEKDVTGGFDKNFITLNGVMFLLERNDRMLVYDLNQSNRSNEHRCSLINMPGPSFCYHEFDTWFSRILGECQGQVCYATTGVTESQIIFNVWMLDEGNWRILHNDILFHDTLAEICFQTCDVMRIRVSGFNPIDRNVVLVGCGNWGWWYNIQTKSFEQLSHSSFLANRDTGVMYESFVLKTMPTILPPPSWIDEDDDLYLKYSPLDMEDDFSHWPN